jgi:acyl carrier protein
MTSITSLVRFALAHRAGCNPSTVRAWLRLDEDLGITPLVRVLVTLELEDAMAVELSTEELARAETVGDLFLLVTRAAAGEQRLRRSGGAA